MGEKGKSGGPFPLRVQVLSWIQAGQCQGRGGHTLRRHTSALQLYQGTLQETPQENVFLFALQLCLSLRSVTSHAATINMFYLM